MYDWYTNKNGVEKNTFHKVLVGSGWSVERIFQNKTCPWVFCEIGKLTKITCKRMKTKGKTGVTVHRDKIELELNNLNSIFSRPAVTPVKTT